MRAEHRLLVGFGHGTLRQQVECLSQWVAFHSTQPNWYFEIEVPVCSDPVVCLQFQTAKEHFSLPLWNDKEGVLINGDGKKWEAEKVKKEGGVLRWVTLRRNLNL